MCPSTSKPSSKGGERYSIEERVRTFLLENYPRAYNVAEVTQAVMETGWSEANVDHDLEDGELVGFVVDVATVSSILDRLVDHGALKRRILNTGDGERSYYRARKK